MNVSYFILIPIDILHLVTNSFRVWRLLQMTSHAIDDRLGDYDVYHNIYYADRDSKDYLLMSRPVFISRFIDAICLHSKFEGGIYGDHITDSDSASDTLGAIERDCILYWNGRSLSIYIDYEDAYRLIRQHGIEYDNDYVIIYSRKYKPASSTKEYARVLYTWIYNELPELFRLMGIVKRMTLTDLQTD